MTRNAALFEANKQLDHLQSREALEITFSTDKSEI